MQFLRWRKLREVRLALESAQFENVVNPREVWAHSIAPLQHRLQIIAKSFPEFEREIKSASYESPQWQGWSINLGPPISDDAMRRESGERLKHDQDAAQNAKRTMLSKLDAILADQPSQDVRTQIYIYVLENRASLVDHGAETIIARELGIDVATVKGHLDILASKDCINLTKTRAGYVVLMSPAQVVRGTEMDTLDNSGSSTTVTPAFATKVFIGHGRSKDWLELRDFLERKLGLQCVEFNTESQAGNSTKERLEQMLNESRFAFLLHTAEDAHTDGSVHARENVIHETGLFQGRLGFRRAIVLLENGCNEFTNIHGLTQIRFPKGSIASAYEEIRDVLKREGIESTSPS